MKIKAILIDLDGTITDTESVYQKNWLIAAKKLGYDFFTREDALSLRSAWRPYGKKLMANRFGDKLDLDKLAGLTTEMTIEELKREGTALKPYAREFLEEIRKYNLKVVLVSATRMDIVRWRLSEVGLSDAFDEVVSAHGTKRGKPYPEPYLFACDEIGVAPEETIAVEDSPNGAESAIAAGCNTVMVPDLTEADDELKGRLYGYTDNLLGVIDYIDV